jgi:hypothetical protein
MRQPHQVDIAMAIIAAEQDHFFTRGQVHDHGGDNSLIARRLRSKRWHAWTRDVFSHAGVAPTDRGQLRIALLDMGPKAMVGFQSGAALLDAPDMPLAPPTLVVPHGTYHTSPGVTIHQTRLMPKPVMVAGMPCTSPLRLLLDLAGVIDVVQLGRLIDDFVARRRTSLNALGKGLEWTERHRRPGAVTLRKALEGRTHGYVPTGSELERVLDAILMTIPSVRAEKEVSLRGRSSLPHRVDRLFRDPPLIVEGDGRLWHARLEQMERDRQRDRRALRLGFPTVRYGWWELVKTPIEVRRELMDLLHPAERKLVG